MILHDCAARGISSLVRHRVKRTFISLVLVLLLSSSGPLAGQAQKQKKTAGVPVKITQAESESHLITNVSPPTPPAALVNEVQGTVVVHLVVSKTGAVERVTPVSEERSLVQSLMGTASHWQFRPFLVNGAPAEAQFDFTYVFKLD
jgi:outer membrane biosynthesis protein TonB